MYVLGNKKRAHCYRIINVLLMFNSSTLECCVDISIEEMFKETNVANIAERTPRQNEP